MDPNENKPLKKLTDFIGLSKIKVKINLKIIFVYVCVF